MTATIDLDLNPIKEDIKANIELGKRTYEVSLYALWENHSKLTIGPDEDLHQFKNEIKPLYEAVFNASQYKSSPNDVGEKAELTPEQALVVYTLVCNHVGELFKKK